MSKTKKEIVLASVASSAAKNRVLTVKDLVIPVNPKRRRRRHQNLQSQGPQHAKGFSVADSYVACLNDPFSCQPKPLGLGTMIPTDTCTAWVRQGFQTAGDGSFCIVVNPSCVRFPSTGGTGGFVALNNVNVGSTVNWSTTYDANDRAALVTDFDQLRPLAGALRVYPRISSNSASGNLYGGVIAPNQNAPQSNSTVPGNTSYLGGTYSTQTIIGFPALEMTIGADPIEVVWRPSELADFDFGGLNDSPANMAVVGEQVPVLVIAGDSWPANSLLTFDVLMHYEGYNSTHGTSTMASGGQSSQVAKDRPASIDQLWQRSRPYLTPALRFISNIARGVGQEMIAKFGGQYGGLNVHNRPLLTNSVILPRPKFNNLITHKPKILLSQDDDYKESYGTSVMSSPHIVSRALGPKSFNDDTSTAGTPKSDSRTAVVSKSRSLW